MGPRRGRRQKGGEPTDKWHWKQALDQRNGANGRGGIVGTGA